eukprot:461822-Pleurochrysis_carterae.AAC.2
MHLDFEGSTQLLNISKPCLPESKKTAERVLLVGAGRALLAGVDAGRASLARRTHQNEPDIAPRP